MIKKGYEAKIVMKVLLKGAQVYISLHATNAINMVLHKQDELD